MRDPSIKTSRMQSHVNIDNLQSNPSYDSSSTNDQLGPQTINISSKISLELTEKIMDELSIVGGSASIKKAQAVAMIRLAGGLHLVHNSIIVNAELPTERAAKWLKKTLEDLYQCSSILLTMHRALPMNQGGYPYVVRVLRQGARLAVLTGLLDRNKRAVRGFPITLMNGNRDELIAIWRGAFLARGRVADPKIKNLLTVSCTGPHVALALSEIAKHLGIQTHTTKVDDIYRISVVDRADIHQLLVMMNAQESAKLWEVQDLVHASTSGNGTQEDNTQENSRQNEGIKKEISMSNIDMQSGENIAKNPVYSGVSSL